MDCLLYDLDEAQDEMALRTEDKDWIAGEIRKSTEALTAALKPRGFAYLLFWIQKLGPPITAIGVVVALLAFSAGTLYQSNGHVKEETEFRTNTGRDSKEFRERFGEIEATLRTLQAAQFPKKVFQEIVALDKQAFARNLPALRKVSERPPTDVVPTVPAIAEVTQKLRDVDQQSPEYWPTVLQFLRFASSKASGEGVPGPGRPNVFTSVFAKAGIPRDPSQKRIHVMGISGPIVGKIVLFDGPPDLLLDSFVFIRCRIIFTDMSVGMQKVNFQDCMFEFPTTDTPNPYLRQVGQQLLSMSNLGNVPIESLQATP